MCVGVHGESEDQRPDELDDVDLAHSLDGTGLFGVPANARVWNEGSQSIKNWVSIPPGHPPASFLDLVIIGSTAEVMARFNNYATIAVSDRNDLGFWDPVSAKPNTDGR